MFHQENLFRIHVQSLLIEPRNNILGTETNANGDDHSEKTLAQKELEHKVIESWS